MAIAPIGIINACHPRQAAIEAFDVASLIHSGTTGFCRNGDTMAMRLTDIIDDRMSRLKAVYETLSSD